jgi:hypothetical protein
MLLHTNTNSPQQWLSRAIDTGDRQDRTGQDWLATLLLLVNVPSPDCCLWCLKLVSLSLQFVPS